MLRVALSWLALALLFVFCTLTLGHSIDGELSTERAAAPAARQPAPAPLGEPR